jgi:hypothetical protein
MSHISTAELALLTSYTKRQVQRMTAAGEVPGALRTPAGHWRVPDSPALREWCRMVKANRRLSSEDKQNRRRGRAAGRDNYVPHLTRLLTVLRKTLPKMTEHQLDALREDSEQLREILNALQHLERRQRSDCAV